ncbi:sialate O-acetylesterase [Algoriphagus boseongensis]|uniref:Sialate O-acetylesterase n=1 Tax=Algoriphagus boseongensis TaxID=1442587 RepID=A0A4R6T8X9_9BACT|nr:sialate O-acetylesterase [Algoriphagus boseongensis]TDQ19171.1 sialate O-acetylesterase [Algoriphagus boseongensis]
MRKYILLFLVIPLFIACGGSKPESEVSFPRLISEGMVIQRDQAISLWGKGIPGEKVRASLAGAIGSTTVLEDSTWKVLLPPLPAGGPFDLNVNIQTVKNIYVGDVWIAGGQSNMEWPLKSGVVGAEEEFNLQEFPNIRFFKVPNDYSAVEKSDVSGGEWKVANAENLPDFSAVAWFFAKKNSLEKNVPVGIIESNWGGTPAEGWTEAKVLAAIPERSYTEEAKEMVENAPKWKEVFAENEKRREMRNILVRRPDSLKAGEVASIAYAESGWSTINLPKDNPMEHIAWVRKRFNLTSTDDLVLVFPRIDQMAYLYINGVQVHYKDWGAGMPDLKIPADILRKGQNVLTIRAVNTWNNRPALGEKDQMYFIQNGKKINLEGTWSYSNSIVEPQLPPVEFFNWKAGVMFNAMIAPLTNYPIKGVIWYQGESNAGRPEEYKELFSTMISNWRARWKIGDFPFLFVQLANFMERLDIQPESNWAYLRDAQTATLELPKTGMAVIIDIGEEKDIHPRNKKDVGERLWLQAEKVAFGGRNLASGPKIDSIYRTENDLKLLYSEIGDGLKLTQGDSVKGFILELEGEKFESNWGKITGKNEVSIQLSPNQNPIGIRYAWADNPEVNLVNSIGLPAWPFKKGL